ncbi:MAG: ferritin [Anaerolineae bacterium]|nr:ferritin [Anaerolineae bacterium]
MLSKKIQDAINEQINRELYSGYLYLAMSAYCEAENFPGIANWMKVQAEEEQEHAERFYDFVNDRGGRVYLKAIDEPPTDFGTPLDIFQASLEHEQFITSSINELYALALAENDYATQIMLQWFISEQIEEEKNASDIVALLEKVGNNVNGLLMVDRQLAQREED